MTRVLGAALILLLSRAIPAQASAIQLNSASDLAAGDTVATYPLNVAPPSTFDLPAGGITLTFSTGEFFTVFAADPSFDFPIDTPLLDTTPNGPLTIVFSHGVKEVGFYAQALGFTDAETFSFEALNGASSLGTFGFGPADNTFLPGTALFIGARATGTDLITRLILGNTSTGDDFFDSSFVVGPVTFGVEAAAEPVPEPMSLLLLGTGLMGVGVQMRRKRAARAKA